MNINKKDNENINEIKKKLREIRTISFRKSNKIRTQEISNLASIIAVNKCVREFINNMQYNFVKRNKNSRGFVIDGRDGVLPIEKTFAMNLQKQNKPIVILINNFRKIEVF